MTNVIYRTKPRLFILVLTFLGFAFFGLLTLMIWPKDGGQFSVLVWLMIFFFATLSLISLFYFLTIKTIKLTQDQLVISFLFLPMSRKFRFDEVRNLSQTKKKITALLGPASFRASYIFTDRMVSISIAGGREIKINSVGTLDFDNLETLFRKLKRGEGKIKQPQRHILLYLIDNLDGLFWMLIALVLTFGLFWHLDF